MFHVKQLCTCLSFCAFILDANDFCGRVMDRHHATFCFKGGSLHAFDIFDSDCAVRPEDKKVSPVNSTGHSKWNFLQEHDHVASGLGQLQFVIAFALHLRLELEPVTFYSDRVELMTYDLHCLILALPCVVPIYVQKQPASHRRVSNT